MRPFPMSSLRVLLAWLLAAGLLAGCSTTTASGVEQARLALDKGDWNKAIESAGEALTSDPSDVEAALLLSSAYAGHAGLQLSRLAAAIADRSRERDLFDLVQDEYLRFRSGAIDAGDLDRALETLTQTLQPQPTRENPLYRDHRFQKGLLLAIKIFLVPSSLAQGTNDVAIDTSAIATDTEEGVEQALLQADDDFLESELAEDEPLVQHVRLIWCVLRAAKADIDGFDLRVLRDIIRCQLSPDDGAQLTAVDFESPSITSCSDFAYDACANAGPTEL